MPEVVAARAHSIKLDFVARSLNLTWLGWYFHLHISNDLPSIGTLMGWDYLCMEKCTHCSLLTLAGVLFRSFFGIEYWMKDSAIVPLRLLRRRSIIADMVRPLSWRGILVCWL